MTGDHKAPDELKHEPEPGYRAAFFALITAALAYLAFILVRG
jgi:hypothetical protein